jgi:hypothetical protein
VSHLDRFASLVRRERVLRTSVVSTFEVLVILGMITGHFGTAHYVVSVSVIDDVVYVYGDDTCTHAIRVLRSSDAPQGATATTRTSRRATIAVMPRNQALVLIARNEVGSGTVQLTINDDRWPLHSLVARVNFASSSIAQNAAIGYVAFDAGGIVKLSARRRFECGLAGVRTASGA